MLEKKTNEEAKESHFEWIQVRYTERSTHVANQKLLLSQRLIALPEENKN